MSNVMNRAAVLVDKVAASAYLAEPQAGGHTGMTDSTGTNSN